MKGVGKIIRDKKSAPNRMSAMPARPQRLMLCIDHFGMMGSGAENYAATLFRALAERGYTIQVVAEDGHGAPPLLDVVHGLKTLAKLKDIFQPDLTIDWGLHERCDLHRLGGGVHAAYLDFSLEAYHGMARWFRRLARFFPKHQRIMRGEHTILNSPRTHFLANSDFVREQACRYGAAAESVTVLYNGVDTRRFRPASATRRNEVRDQWGVAAEDVVFLFVAHNLKLKNLQLLRTVLSSATARMPQLKLVVAGKRAPRFQAPWFIYHGPESCPERLYAGADVLVHPTYFDACANVVLEAMSSGLPVVVSNRSGIHGLINHEKNGVILPVSRGTPVPEQVWEQTLVALAQNPEERKKLGNAARKTAEEHDFLQYVKQFEQLLQTVYQRKKRTRMVPDE